MKFKSPSKKSLKDNAVLVGSATAGAVVAKGVVDGLIPGQKSVIKSAIASISTAVLAAAITGSSTASDAVRGLLAGMSITQAVETITQIAQKNASTFSGITNTHIKGFVDNAFELNTGLAGVSFSPYQNLPAAGRNDLWDAPIIDNVPVDDGEMASYV